MDPMMAPAWYGGEQEGLDVAPVAYVLGWSDPDLWVGVLPGESLEELRARRAAAADILDDLLVEAAGLLGGAA